jgi:hypothetical protein
MMRYPLPAVLMLVLVAARPAAAVLTDDEPSNDCIVASGGCSGASIQIFPTAAVTTDGGVFTLVDDDIDYLGIGSLVVGDIVTVSTTPLDDILSDPDTIIGLFNGSETEKCEGDDSVNNLLGIPDGLGSLCRFEIDSAGTWFVGVTGFSTSPFDGDHIESGAYQLMVTINVMVVPPTPTATPTSTPTATPTVTPTSTPTATPTPEPGVMLQLVSGGIGMAWLNRRRNRRMSRASQRSG